MKNKEYTDVVEKAFLTLDVGYPENPLVPLDDPFINDSGSIQNLLNTTINSAAVITSKKGSVRSNHWHQNDWHYLYVLSGSMEYYERNVGDPRDPEKKPIIVSAGQMVFTPPNEIHKTVFLENTILLSFSRQNRDHDSHESDVVREEY